MVPAEHPAVGRSFVGVPEYLSDNVFGHSGPRRDTGLDGPGDGESGDGGPGEGDSDDSDLDDGGPGEGDPGDGDPGDGHLHAHAMVNEVSPPRTSGRPPVAPHEASVARTVRRWSHIAASSDRKAMAVAIPKATW